MDLRIVVNFDPEIETKKFSLEIGINYQDLTYTELKKLHTEIEDALYRHKIFMENCYGSKR